MSLERLTNQKHSEVVDKFHDPNADYEMSVRDYVLRPSAQGAGAITITLPPVAEAKGQFYSIIARTASAVNTITVQDRDDSECWLGDIVMDGKCDRALLYSDGLAWLAMGNVGWPGVETTAAPGTATATTARPATDAPTSLAPTTTGT